MEYPTFPPIACAMTELTLAVVVVSFASKRKLAGELSTATLTAVRGEDVWVAISIAHENPGAIRPERPSVPIAP